MRALQLAGVTAISARDALDGADEASDARSARRAFDEERCLTDGEETNR